MLRSLLWETPRVDAIWLRLWPLLRSCWICEVERFSTDANDDSIGLVPVVPPARAALDAPVAQHTSLSSVPALRNLLPSASLRMICSGVAPTSGHCVVLLAPPWCIGRARAGPLLGDQLTTSPARRA